MVFYKFVDIDSPLKEISVSEFDRLVSFHKYFLLHFKNNLFIYEAIDKDVPKFLYCMVIL